MVACLLWGRCAIGQVFPPSDGTAYTPNTVFNDSTATTGREDNYRPRPTGQEDILPVRGDREPGALQNVSFSQPVGEYGTMNVYGSPDPESYGAGAGFNVNPSAWLYVRDLQAAVYSSQDQTVVNAGSTLSLFSNERFGVGGRALFGATVDDNLQDELHFSGDAFVGVRLPGETWLKGGFLYDTQDSFYKYGPTFGAVLLADAKHPLTVDFAYGMGKGDNRPGQNGVGILGVADDDVQLRVGTYLSPTLQLGLSGNWARWDDTRFEDGEGIGGFARISIADLDVTVDVTDGDLGTRGFVNVAYVFGGPHRKDWRNRSARSFVDRPQDWMTRPVARDTSLRVQRFVEEVPPGGRPGDGTGPRPLPPGQQPLVGNITQVDCRLLVNPAQDSINPGVIDPGDGFNLVVTLGNASTQTASNVSISNLTADQGFVVFNTPPNEIIASQDIPPGGTSTLIIPTASLGIDPSTAQGSTFNLDFNVTANGQTRRFSCGPIRLGQSGNATPAEPATPIN